ncbi:hypothetical protein PHYBLDRAFT_147182 [Phycomyces blakesleeanus NRRL 1555(-)]|uniref:Uncharacterized protein n=1 Tax=Phycomyces blakesleeanus (strain ATCC 8743b / DSM 1359 / FGSC 10004 / NBRC 33097 / NRRL 1555) TaxID=763407 RepID=A0A163DLU9_PHYB8|nr:hypothetical protein PHYBLDRAFT_147182 [Phycomyces blakesleeanus NRRL 1555(-)]OAD72210.1 hypothetical protein PHYBLDRAFT_147182 [Phycomyces blakesleeanus NRRL 1555(-)]|eukprot:XP_018290250.1 hypothetical protein PHYBLDRAFT_147182 [Phycomyces blakesleeanus NRRL 1555(-)]
MSTSGSNKRPAQEPLSSKAQNKKSKEQGNSTSISTAGFGNYGKNILSQNALRVTGAIDTKQFVIARLPEMNAMQSVIKETRWKGLPPQLRAHRRRAASYKLTGFSAMSRAKISSKRGRMFIKGKKPLRTMFQLKPTVYAKEYLYKQSNKKWLETHMWHVKRMKMVNIWGHRLASHPNMKSSRIFYRAFTQAAVIHDASYESCVELSGASKQIVRILNTITDPSLPSVGSARYNKGQRMGKTYLYEYMQYPTNLICPIEYLWRPSKVEGEQGMIWVWIHPSAYTEALCTLKEAIKHGNEKSTENIQICEQKEKLVRFNLAGPHSTALLQSIFRPIEEAEVQIERANTTEQTQLWDDIGSLKSACSLSPDVIIGLTVQDPRLKFPQLKRPQIHEVSNEVEARLSTLIREWPIDVAYSDIWESTSRQASLDSKVSEYALNKRREENVVPGTKLVFTEKDSRIPILLVCRTCPVVDDSTIQTSTSVSSRIESWSIILPSGWGMPFWTSLLFAGAKPIGLENVRSLALETGQCCFPYDYPSTRAFAAQKAQMEEANLKKWLSRPPAKRENFKRIGVDHPFAAQFDTLFRKNGSTDDVLDCVPKPNYSLIQGARMISSIATSSSETSSQAALEKAVIECLSKRSLNILSSVSLNSTLVKVRVKYIEKKVPFPNALVYLIENPDDYMRHTWYIRNRMPVHQSKKDIKLSLKNETMSDTTLDEKHHVLPSSQQIGYITNGAFSLMHGCGIDRLNYNYFAKSDNIIINQVANTTGVKSVFKMFFSILSVSPKK